MHGALSLACLKRSRTRDAPTPTNISTNSEPEADVKGTPASPAMARASRGFPVPGGPVNPRFMMFGHFIEFDSNFSQISNFFKIEKPATLNIL